jgi:hypothetical protein
VDKVARSPSSAYASAFIIGLIIGAPLMFSLNRGGCGARTCVGNPVSEVTTAVQKATTGLKAESQRLCLEENEGFSAEGINRRLSGINVTFKCDSYASICRDSEAPLVVTSDTLSARRRAEFKAVVECEDTMCTVEITDFSEDEQVY